jgi:hypothetical protein
MQIFELTQQPVNEVDYSKTGGSSAAGGFLRGLGSTVGIKSPDPDPEDPKKLLSQQIQDAEKYFDVAVDLLERNYPETTVIARLTNRYGATKPQALNAVETALAYIEKEQQDRETDGRTKAGVPTATGPFDTMVHQLGKRQANPGRFATPPAAPVATTPMTPEQIRMAKQKFAGAIARAQMSASSAPATTATAPASQSANTNDVSQALISLGYKSKEAAAMAAKVPPGTSIQNAIKLALAGKLKESLTWSRNFDPSATLLKKIKSQ